MFHPPQTQCSIPPSVNKQAEQYASQWKWTLEQMPLLANFPEIIILSIVAEKRKDVALLQLTQSQLTESIDTFRAEQTQAVNDFLLTDDQQNQLLFETKVNEIFATFQGKPVWEYWPALQGNTDEKAALEKIPLEWQLQKLLAEVFQCLTLRYFALSDVDCHMKELSAEEQAAKLELSKTPQGAEQAKKLNQSFIEGTRLLFCYEFYKMRISALQLETQRLLKQNLASRQVGCSQPPGAGKEKPPSGSTPGRNPAASFSPKRQLERGEAASAEGKAKEVLPEAKRHELEGQVPGAAPKKS